MNNMPGLNKLIAIIQDIAQGNYSDDIMALTGPDQPEGLRQIAEAMAMMMVKVEAREFHLENLAQELRALNRDLKLQALATVEAMALALGARDDYTKGHGERVGELAAGLAAKIEFKPDQIEEVRIAGILHDVGKICFSDQVFQNEDTVPSPELISEIRTHPQRGADIVASLDFLGPVREYVLYHHERPDGGGYPFGLKGDEIPLGARIISVADVYDAVTTDRPYQKGKSREQALAILDRLAGAGLDEALVENFKQI
jgi:HD-GYP domain-containing protein (c-di-GMP phosphodiesterase class II)